MPLLSLFSKKNRSSSKVATTAYSNSLDDHEYVSVTAPSLVSHSPQSSASSSKLALPFRRKREHVAVEELSQQSHVQYPDPLLDPPPRRSSIFQTYQDDPNAYRSTHSLPDDTAGRPPVRPQPLPQQPGTLQPGAPKKSMFSWSSHKSVSPAKPASSEADASFSLKSFRHVRPDSPILGPSGTRSPSPAPVLAPIPTTTLPSPPVAFQVTSRRPRGNSTSELTNSGSLPQTVSQQKMAAGAFRQAARRSTTSLSLGDSPVLSPVRTSLDDRPPPSLLPPLQAATDTTSRSPRPQSPLATYTPKLTTSPTSSDFSASAPSNLPASVPSNFPASVSSRSVASPSLKPTPVKRSPRTRTNAFADSDSSSSPSEDEDEDDESTSDAGVVGPRISRRRTVKQKQGESQPPTLPPLSSSVREQIQRATPPLIPSSSSRPESSISATTNDVPRAQSSVSLYSASSRPRASLSVGSLTPTAKETRASIALAANSRLANSEY